MIHGDCLEQLKLMPADSVDSLVTDPPAGISFMGKDWDHDKGGRHHWIAWMTDVMRECYRVMKPGAHGLVWALPRTSHWTGTALEDAGFEVRDVVTHLFGTGFPKSLNVEKAGAGKEWAGFGTALKPASEHWILARKPISEKTVAANVLKWGTGALNIDASRINVSESDPNHRRNGSISLEDGGKSSIFKMGGRNPAYGGNTLAPSGRFPANLVLDEQAAMALDEQSGMNRGAASPVRKKPTPATTNIDNIKPHDFVGDDGKSFHGDSGGASRFFYVAKASKSERGPENHHPTVKSLSLMSYLINLITPPRGIVLDPFMGSGSTGVAAIRNGFEFVGIEKDQEYYNIACKRILSHGK